MSNLLPEAKVTIFIEEPHRITKVTIPLASSPVLATDISTDLETGEPAEKRFGFGCYALFDIDNNGDIFTETMDRVPE
jgi:hypothetical protein